MMSFLCNLQLLEKFYSPQLFLITIPPLHNNKQASKSQSKQLITSEPAHHSLILVSQQEHHSGEDEGY